MNPLSLIPQDIQDLYEIFEWKHAATIMAIDFPEEFREICGVLRQFCFTRAQIVAPGGSESEIPKTFSSMLRPLGWREDQLKARLLIDNTEVRSDTHKIDYLKNRIALDLEWNSKDQTFDRDLYAFRSFFEYGRISTAVLVTRSNELDEFFASLGRVRDKYGVEREVKAKYGASTTHMRKLIPRLEAGRSGGCPVLVYGITPRLLAEA